MDAWWPRDAAAKKEALSLADIQPRLSNPLTIFAVDAPKLSVWHCKRRSPYSKNALQMLAAKVILIFVAAQQLQSPLIFSGLLGGGAFRNNRPLVLLLHLLLQPRHCNRPVTFHHPVFRSFANLSTQSLEKNIVDHADSMLDSLRGRGVTVLGDALAEILSWGISLSERDMDLV
jgi:hypothetical protein